MPGVMNVVAARRAVPCARGEREELGPLPEEGEEIRRWWLLVSRGLEENVSEKTSKRRRAMKMRYGLSAVLMLFMAVQPARADEAAPTGAATPPAAEAADTTRKKIAKQLAECAGCEAASKKAGERAAQADDKIGAAQCEVCKGYWAANGNEKNGGFHFSKKCQQCARMEAAGRDGPCDTCQKAHSVKKKEKRDRN